MGKTTVDAHLYRLKTRGVDLEKYIEKQINNGGILAAWAETPSGFKFACKDIKSFMMELIMNANFAVDTGIGQRFQKGASFREVSKSDSLHILVFKNGYCNELKTRLDYVNVHLDSVSPVRGRDKKNVLSNMNLAKLFNMHSQIFCICRSLFGVVRKDCF